MKRKIRFRIRTKIILLTAILAVLLASVAMIFFGIVINNNNNRQYKGIATSLSNTVAATIDTQKVKNVVNHVMLFYDPDFSRENEGKEGYDEYLAKFDEVRNTQDYKDVQEFLRDVKNSYTDADAVYLGAVDYERKLCIYIVYNE